MEVIQDELQKNGDRLRMEVIADELWKNGVGINAPSLIDKYTYRILVTYKAMYNEATSRLKSNQLIDVFHENCFNTVGRVMAYLTLVRCMKFLREEDVRKAARLVAVSIRNITRIGGVTSLRDAPIPEQVFMRTLCSSVGYTPMDTI